MRTFRHKPLVDVGAYVTAGTPVARVGDSDAPTCDRAPHVHLEIRYDGMRRTTNPINLIEAEWADATLGVRDSGTSFAVDLDAPEWVTTPDDFSVWRVVAKIGCSPAAVRAWHDELQSAEGGAPFNWLHTHRDEWLREFDAQHDD